MAMLPPEVRTEHLYPWIGRRRDLVALGLTCRDLHKDLLSPRKGYAWLPNFWKDKMDRVSHIDHQRLRLMTDRYLLPGKFFMRTPSAEDVISMDWDVGVRTYIHLITKAPLDDALNDTITWRFFWSHEEPEGVPSPEDLARFFGKARHLGEMARKLVAARKHPGLREPYVAYALAKDIFNTARRPTVEMQTAARTRRDHVLALLGAEKDATPPPLPLLDTTTHCL